MNTLGWIMDNTLWLNVDNMQMIFSFLQESILRWNAFVNYWVIVLVQDENKTICVPKWRGIWKIATQTGLHSLVAAYVVLPQGQDRTHLNCFVLIAGSKCQAIVHISLCLIRNDCIGTPRATNCDLLFWRVLFCKQQQKKGAKFDYQHHLLLQKLCG